MLPEVPGIIEGSMMIALEADGRVSLRVLIRPEEERVTEYGLIELLIKPEDLGRALDAASRPADRAGELVMYSCHIGVGRHTDLTRVAALS